MLTPIEVQGKAFKGSGMGYSKTDVDSFFTQISADYMQLYEENRSLKEEINNLNNNLAHYRDIEKSLQKALVLAETTAEETILSAKKNATVIEQEAVLKAQTIVADAKVDLDKLRVQISDLLKQYESYRSQVKALAKSQYDLMNSESFDIGPLLKEDLSGLEKTASEHIDVLQADPVSAEKSEPAKKPEEQEENYDETLSTDDSMIRDFSEMFDENKNEENNTEQDSEQNDYGEDE